jgi:hypothetical protein
VRRRQPEHGNFFNNNMNIPGVLRDLLLFNKVFNIKISSKIEVVESLFLVGINFGRF